LTIVPKINIRFALTFCLKYGIMLPNLQNRIVNITRHWGQKGDKMKTSQVENKFSHPHLLFAGDNSHKPLPVKNLQTNLARSSIESSRQTLVSHFKVKTYDRRKTEIRLIDPVTFQSKIGNRKLKIGFSHPSTFPPSLSLFGCHKSLILEYRKSPQTHPTSDLWHPLFSLRLCAFAGGFSGMTTGRIYRGAPSAKSGHT